MSSRQGDLKVMQERLLNAYLAGAVEEQTFRAKSAELKVEQERAAEAVERARGDMDASRGDMALRVFDWAQRLGELWRGLNIERRRAILETVCSNRLLDDVSLRLEKRKPFEVLAKGPECQSGTPDWPHFQRAVAEFTIAFELPHPCLLRADELAREWL
ncbi:MAG: hypothetical protein GXY85_07115 [Candidatus Brocadiaceae bacterium]|nr:hypothetical protein [Candidatus Brocadiaceae bacterium]